MGPVLQMLRTLRCTGDGRTGVPHGGRPRGGSLPAVHCQPFRNVQLQTVTPPPPASQCPPGPATRGQSHAAHDPECPCVAEAGSPWTRPLPLVLCPSHRSRPGGPGERPALRLCPEGQRTPASVLPPCPRRDPKHRSKGSRGWNLHRPRFCRRRLAQPPRLPADLASAAFSAEMSSSHSGSGDRWRHSK